MLDQLNFVLMFLADDLYIRYNYPRFAEEVELHDYCTTIALTANYSKTKVLVFSKSGRKRNDERRYYNGESVEVVKQYPYLGLIISSTDFWKAAVENLIRKGTRASTSIFGNLGHFGRMTRKTKMLIYDSKILPILLYGCEIWGAYEITATEVYVRMPRFHLCVEN